MAALGFDRQRLGALLRLRARLTLRRYTRERGRIIGAIIGLLFFGPLVLGIAVGSAIGYLRLPDEWPGELLAVILVGLWLIWIVYPIFVTSLNEGLDLTRLLIYPLARRDLVAGVFLGTLFDYPTYLMAPLLVAVLVGWGFSAALPVVVVGVFLVYLQMVVASQLMITIFGGILQSRRFRDVFIVAASLLGSLCYFIQLGTQRLTSRVFDSLNEGQVDQLLALRPSLFLRWTPPGAVARGIVDASSGEWLFSLLWMAYGMPLTGVLVFVWWHLLQRLLTGQGFLIPAGAPDEEKKRAPGHSEEVPESRWRWLGVLPLPLQMLVVKELKNAWRIPQRRVALLQMIIIPIIILAPILTGLTDGEGSGLPVQIGLSIPLYALFIYWFSTQNMLGWEGPALKLLLTTPVSRAYILRSKTLALGLLGVPPFLAASAAILFVHPNWYSVTGILYAVPAILLLLTVNATASVFFPYPVNLESRQMNRNTFSGGGCVAVLANLLAVPLVEGVLLTPAVALVALAAWLEIPLIALGGWPFVLIYAGLIYWFVTGWASGRMVRREPEIIQATRFEEGD